MKYEGTAKDDLRAQEWPTCDQERELHLLRHVTDPVHTRRFDGEVFDFELRMNNEVVTAFVPQIVAHWASIKALKAAGMLVLVDDGVKILYLG